MTPQQLHGTRLLSDLLVLMLKDARSNDPNTAADAREWLNAPPLEGMASLQRTCEQLAAAEQSITRELSKKQAGRTDTDWLAAVKEADQDASHGVARLELEVTELLQRCDQRPFDASQDNSAGLSHPKENYPSPSDNSPTF